MPVQHYDYAPEGLGTARSALSDSGLPHQPGSDSLAPLQTFADRIRQIMRADVVGVIRFCAPGPHQWEATTGLGDQATDCRDELLSNLAHSNLTSESIFLGDIDEAAFPALRAEGIRSVAIVPLTARGEQLGVLFAGNRSVRECTAEDRQLLDSLAEVAALALDNARLLETVISGKKMWERTFDAIKCGIVIHDDQLRVVRCNDFAAEMMSRMPAQIVGRSWRDCCADLFGERAAAHYLDKVRDNVSSFELPAASGVRYLISVAPLDAVGGESGSVVTWNDVSEVSRMQEQLSRSKRLTMVGQLAASVAHEINNPVASIAACAEAALRDMRQTSDTEALAEQHQWTFHLEQIVEQALRCKSITRGLLDLARQRRPSLAARDLNELVTASVKLAKQRADPAKFSYVLDLDPDLAEIAIDAGMVQQVLDNLLINARDALGRDGGRIKVTTSFDADRVAIDVSDTGQGISPDQLARIFDPFYTTKETGKGSGLGLAISCTLAEGMGGAVTVNSKAGEGSRFRLWLPQRMPEKDPT